MNNFALLLLIIGIGSFTSSSLKNPVVNTTLGLIRGVKEFSKNGTGFYSFRGVPYAETPQRFKPPKPISAWDGILEATEGNSGCYQSGSLRSSEDCLKLNIYTHQINVNNVSRPVLVYIHGGNSLYFSGQSTAHPDYIMDNDIVLVTVNYRLGFFGFFSTGDNHAPGNYGLKDQVEALKWVKNNIHSFGGDPNKVTIAGDSTGGASVGLHLVSPMSRGLFHRAMIFSGSALNPWATFENPLEMAKKQAEFYECPSDTSENIVNCISKLPANAIRHIVNIVQLEINKNNEINDHWYKVDPLYAPIVEIGNNSDRFLVKPPIESLINGEIADVPIFIGTTRDEMITMIKMVVDEREWMDDLSNNWTSIAPTFFQFPQNDTISGKVREFYFGNVDRPLNSDSMEKLNDLFSDSTITFDVLRFAKLVAEKNTQPVYLYQFNYVAEELRSGDGIIEHTVNIKGRPSVGHGNDLIYIFYPFFIYPAKLNLTGVDGQFVNKYTTLWTNFMETGNPTPAASQALDNVIWKPYTNAHPTYLDINETLTARDGLYNEKRIAFWESIKPIKIGEN